VKFQRHIQPRLLLLAVSAVALLMFGTATLELRQSREELYHVLSEHALSLASTIAHSGENNLLSTERLEDLLTERLLNNAYYIAYLDSAGLLRDNAELAAIATANRLFRVNIYNIRGAKVLASHTEAPEHAGLGEKNSPATILAPIFRGETNRLVIGLKEARVEEGQRYAVAVRRTRTGGGAVVVNLDAQDLVAFRRSLGFGRLLQEFGANPGIAYLVLQDTQGIIAASKGVRELSATGGDSLIAHAVAADTTVTRVTEYDGQQVFEVIQPFALEGHHLGVLRIGLSMDEVRSAEARLFRRMVIISLVVVFLGGLAFFFLLSQQSYRAMEKEYSSIKSFTGNILSHMREGVITVNAGGTVTIFNASAEEMTGLRREAVEGRHPASLPGAGATLAGLFEGPDASKEIIFQLPDGRRRTIASSLSTSRSSEGDIEGRTVVLRDLTEARMLEQEVQRKDKITALGELAAGVAHEIRNPLNAIAMIAQRFRKEFTPRSGVREYRTLADVLQDEARRVNTIIRQFLSFARPPKLDRQQVPLKEFLRNVAALFEGQATSQGVAFFLEAEDQLAVSIDRDHMTQALLNLLRNALDATPTGGKITLTGTVDGPEASITVADDGKGISASDAGKIFNLYFTTKEDGTGLGLPITQQIVAEHGGRLSVDSEEGRGTIVTIRLPTDSLP
jgi:two-component system sensor histidine kinase HydH